MRWLLDSVILIDHFNGIGPATRFIAEEAIDIALSPVTRAEVLTGFTDEHRPLAAELLDQFPTLAITAAEADLAAGLRRSEGWRLPDALQAAVARHNELELVTRNTKDFPPERYDFVTVPYVVAPPGVAVPSRDTNAREDSRGNDSLSAGSGETPR